MYQELLKTQAWRVKREQGALGSWLLPQSRQRSALISGLEAYSALILDARLASSTPYLINTRHHNAARSTNGEWPKIPQ